MSLLDDLQEYVESNNLMGAWVQKGRAITHVTEGMDTGIVMSLGSFGLSVSDLYKSQGRGPDSFLFGYTSGAVLLINLKASLVGFALPPDFTYIDELVEGGRRAALKATLELLQAQAVLTIEEVERGAAEESDAESAEFTRWGGFLDIARSELTRVLHASQVDGFIRRQLKGDVPTTLLEVLQAAERIADGIPDKGKRDAFKKIFEENISKLKVN